MRSILSLKIIELNPLHISSQQQSAAAQVPSLGWSFQRAWSLSILFFWDEEIRERAAMLLFS